MSYKKGWYRDYSFEVRPDGSYRIEIPNSATDKVIIGNKNNELFDLVLCLFDELNKSFPTGVDTQKPG